GVPQIEVTFDIDANGIVNVSAKDKATGKEQQVRIQASGGLSDEDIENMVQDAEVHADTDKKARELVEARNQADSLIHMCEKNLREHGEKASAEDRSAIEDAVAALKEVKDGDDADEITSKAESLTQASMKLGEAMYRAEQEASSGDADDSDDGAGKPTEDATVVDADFEEVDPDEDKKKDD
ncbi:MAG: Hsp70 family protein, partial [Rhodospirillales bacterium]|nr:Hsp70 family protein [Rhodospirillales bacterium]